MARAARLTTPGRRALVGVAGSPGSGKTTLSQELVRRINTDDALPRAAYLPMDGFHLANSVLADLGRAERKGALDTFDGWGFLALLTRLASDTTSTVYAPEFHRDIETAIAAEIAVEPEDEIVVVEGNYLLAPERPWSLVTDVLEESWFCSVPGPVRHERLVARHLAGGRSPEDAEAWARNVDGANAAFIESTRDRATILVEPPPLA